MLDIPVNKRVPKTVDYTNLPMYKDYQAWLEKASVDARFVYYIGNQLSESDFGYRIGKLMMAQAYQGKIYLFQKKLGPHSYEHIAVKANDPPRRNLVPNKYTRMRWGVSVPDNSKGD